MMSPGMRGTLSLLAGVCGTVVSLVWVMRPPSFAFWSGHGGRRPIYTAMRQSDGHKPEL